MGKYFTLLLLIWSQNSKSQTLEKGIYEGTKFPFTICYLTYNGDSIEVEYFFKKASTYFDRFPAETLSVTTSNPSRNFTIASSNDSLNVKFKKKYFVVKHKSLGRIKVYKSVITEVELLNLRNKVDQYQASREGREARQMLYLQNLIKSQNQ